MHRSDLYARRASSFGANAQAYAEHRPDYPAEAIEWIIDDRGRVLDLGAGTGKLTAGLLAFGVEIVAVEPDAAMRAELTARYPDVPIRDGNAEHIPLRDGSVEAVMVGQAFHWFNTPEAMSEIARVLKPGGVFGALWNADDESVPWVRGMMELASTSLGGLGSTGDRPVPSHELLAAAETAEFRHSQRRTVESMMTTLGTHSHIAVLDDAERTTVVDRVRRYLEMRMETATGEFDRPLVTTAVRAVRR
ncbi:MAG: class I SAM-dependent methyltransferase [Actinomycetota bacterium]|nr:class I SAM-dependent methyltransferase [Actinomycetota bacterium]